jgi:hypothetical protein
MAFVPENANPDFGTDLSDWSDSGGGTISRIDISADDPPAGSNGWAMHIVPDGASQFPGGESDHYAVAPGEYKWGQATVRCSDDHSVGIDVNWFDVAHAYLSTTNLTVAAEAGVWYEQGSRRIAPVDAAFYSLKITIPDTPAASITVDVDFAGIGDDPTSESLTIGMVADASVEGTGPRDPSVTVPASATATGSKDSSAAASGGMEASGAASGSKDTSGSGSAASEASTASSGTKASSGEPVGSLDMVMSSSATGRVQGEEVVFSDFPPLRWRIRAYDPDGTLRGQLPVPLGWTVALPFDDLSSMTLEYANSAPGIDLLQAPCEVVLELSDENAMFQEYPDCRFLNIRQSQDLIQADVTTKLTMPSYGWMLRKVRNINTATFNEEGNRVFTNVTVGALINTFLTEAHTRGNVPFLVTDFNATNDSDGEAWTNLITIEVAAGQDLWSLLQTMVAQGQCDFRMNGRTLQLYKADTFLNRDQTLNPTAKVLHTFRDVSAAPDDRSYEDIAHTILVQGDDAKFVTVEQAVNPSPWGEWENFMTQSGVTDTGVLNSLAVRALEMANAPRTQMTRELVFRSQSPLPIIDYRSGDHVLAQDETALMDDLRVRQITLTMGGEALTGNVVLGDKFTERDIRIQRQIAALAGSASTIGGSGTTPTVPTTPIPDTSVPAQVTGLVLAADSYVDELGRPRGLFSAQWAEVTLDTGGDPQDISSYRVRWSALGSGFWKQRTVGGDTLITWIGEDIQVLTIYTVEVAAVGSNNIQGAWSDSENIFIPADATAPPVPSDPVVTSRLGTLRVHWDGLDEDTLPMPADFARVEVEMGNTGSGPFAVVGTVSSTSDLIIADQPYEAERFFRFRAVDTSGNTSGYSGVVSGSTEPLVDTDIIGQVIDGANIVDGTLVASDKIVANSITGGLIEALAINAGHIQANAITSDKIEAGAITAEKISAYSIDATRLAIGGNRNLVADGNAANEDLGTARTQNATGLPNSATAIDWTHESDAFYRAKLSSAVGEAFGRIGWHANTGIDPDLASGTIAVDPLFVYPVDRTMGGLHGKIAYNVSLDSGTWPAGSTVAVVVFGRWVLKDGTMATSFVLANTGDDEGVTGGWVTVSATTPVSIPADAVGVISYARVRFVNGTTLMNVDLSEMFLGQVNGGVLIEDGSITANKIVANAITATKIAANAITTDQLSANAITSKHTITGSVIQTASSQPRVIMSPNANYLGQHGIRLDSSGSGARDTNIFIASTTEGGWEQYSFAIVGPEVTRNSSGRADLNFKTGGGFFMKKQWVTDSRFAGVEAPTASNELLLAGTIPRGTQIGDAFGAVRGLTSNFAINTITWGFNNGWAYRGAICPNSPGSTPRYGCMQSTSSSSFTYNCNASVDNVDMWLYRGGYIL